MSRAAFLEALLTDPALRARVHADPARVLSEYGFDVAEVSGLWPLELEARESRSSFGGLSLAALAEVLEVAATPVPLPAAAGPRSGVYEVPVPAAARPTASLHAPFAAEIVRAARRERLDPALLAGLIRQESGFDPEARSPAGAVGLCQLMPPTADALGVKDATDPAQAIAGGARYLREQLDRFGGDERLALAAYNAGPDAVRRYAGIPPYEETRDYVRRVLAFAQGYREGRRGVRERLVELARGELGTAETAHNDGARIAHYREATTGSAPGQPWCAYFVSWVAERAGRPLGDARQGFGAVRDIWAWGQAHHRAVLAGPEVRPRPGDLIVFGADFHHVGIVERVREDGTIETVEGNYANQVAEVVRGPGDDIYGYVRMG